MREIIAKNFVLIICLLGISACKDECSKVTTHYDITPALKDFYFKKGTYWVYEDTVNHVVDSQYVYLDSLGNHFGNTRTTNGSYCSVSKQFLKYYIQSNMSGYVDSFVYGMEAGSLGNSDLGIFGVKIPYNGNFILWLNKPVGQIQSDSRYNGVIYQNINGTGYNNVFWFSSIIGTGLAHDFLQYNTDFYFVPKIGIVKKVEFGTPAGTRTWLLKQYYINK